MEWIALIVAGVCLYQIHGLKKQTGCKEKNIDKEKLNMERQNILRERLFKLIGSTCEIEMKKPLLQVDMIYSALGVLETMDDDWIMLVTKKKNKDIKRVIKIDDIKEVKEIIL